AIARREFPESQEPSPVVCKQLPREFRATRAKAWRWVLISGKRAPARDVRAAWRFASLRQSRATAIRHCECCIPQPATESLLQPLADRCAEPSQCFWNPEALRRRISKLRQSLSIPSL